MQSLAKVQQKVAETGFDYEPITRVVFGIGSLDRLGRLAVEIGGSHALLVTDPGVRAAGHVDRGIAALSDAGIRVTLFDRVIENPTTKTVSECVETARTVDVDHIIGLGGGSSLDTAKGTNFILTNGGKMADYWGVGKATRDMLPMIAVPTTAGTGSEAQSFAVIADEHTHQKMACGDKRAACKIALLDPEVTVTQPASVTAVCGMDAIAHAVESYVTNKRTPISRIFSKEAWDLLSNGFGEVLDDGNDVEARGRMLLGAYFAGSAIENSMLGATHSAANPLTARYGLTHGIAIGIMLPHVVRFNSEICDDLYEDLCPSEGWASAGGRLAVIIEQLREKARLPATLSECGVEQSAIESLAESAAAQWTAQFNPRPVSAADFVLLYEQAF